jgi:ribosomal protein S18 acetylase RimI-like enzyme
MSSLCWRAMIAADLVDVQAIAGLVHAAYPERSEVFAERLRLHPAGCFVLTDPEPVVGYAVSHPWDGPPPALDVLLQGLPPAPRTLYIHDIALLPHARGRRAVADLMVRLSESARQQRLPTLSLTAVGGTTPVWQHMGFRVDAEPAYAAKLATYGDNVVFMVRDV